MKRSKEDLAERRKSGWASVRKAFSRKKNAVSPAEVDLDDTAVVISSGLRGNPDCSSCGCRGNRFDLKQRTARIHIVTPDIKTFCPCPEQTCPPEAIRKLYNNVKITIQRVDRPNIDAVDSEYSIRETVDTQVLSEPMLTPRTDYEELARDDTSTDS